MIFVTQVRLSFKLDLQVTDFLVKTGGECQSVSVSQTQRHFLVTGNGLK